MQAVPAFHNGFLINYEPVPYNYRQVVTNLVRILSALILLASVSMQSYAPPAPLGIDYTLSQHQTRPSIEGLSLGDLTNEELEDYLSDTQDRHRREVMELNELLATVEQTETHMARVERVQNARADCQKWIDAHKPKSGKPVIFKPESRCNVIE